MTTFEQNVTPDAATGCQVYGIVSADAASLPSDASGIDDAPLRTVAHGPVAAVIAEVPLDAPSHGRAALLSYSRAIDALDHSGGVAPMRFGTVLPDEKRVVTDLLEPHEQYFRELLERLAGHAQFTVRARYHDGIALAEIVASNTAVAELRELTRGRPEEEAYAERVQLGELVAKAMDTKRQADAEALIDVIGPLGADHTVRIGSGTERIADIALLVADDRRDELEQRLEELAESVHERIRLSLLGPTAPYDFVGSE